MADTTAQLPRVVIEAVPGLPEVAAGDDLGGLIVAALGAMDRALEPGDVLAVAQKVVSKAEGRVVALADVAVGAEARALASEVGKPAAKVQLILDESREVLRTRPPAAGREGVLIVRHKLGFICANAGIDESNTGVGGAVVLLPRDPDASARALRERIGALSGVRPGVVITDSFGRPWRLGLVNVAIGLAGPAVLNDLTGTTDADGRPLSATVTALADEIAAASGLVVAKAGRTPVTLIRGLSWVESDQTATAVLRPARGDLFL